MSTHDPVREALAELVALVRGECPSLLDEDSGGNARLSMLIDETLSVQPAHDVLKWTDEWNCEHEMTREGAIEHLRKFWDEWPGGFEEIDSSIRQLRERALAAAPSPTPPARVALSDEQIVQCARRSIAAEVFAGAGSQLNDFARTAIAEYERLNGITPAQEKT